MTRKRGASPLPKQKENQPFGCLCFGTCFAFPLVLCEHSPPCGARKIFGMLSHLILAFSTAAVLARCLRLPPAAATHEPQRATLVGMTRKPWGKPAATKTKRHPMGVFVLVAERGLEPPDLRVMSPTSYHLLHSAIYHARPSRVPRAARLGSLSWHLHDASLVPVTGVEPVRYFRINGF